MLGVLDNVLRQDIPDAPMTGGPNLAQVTVE